MENNTYNGNHHADDGPVVICDGTVPVYATIDVNCKGGKTFTISTGTKGGTCEVITKGDSVTNGFCGDADAKPKPASATVNCHVNGGEGACGKVEGSGSCRVTQ
ncbi:hypothetical protein D3OALGA1CA_2050 [Olavius algarvensis associated proteobacterium Delta 3]|nr:hypothetical protein D3OALGA1CA_2050 [Olavius algarvensis associated proteobacterium Delta 3]